MSALPQKQLGFCSDCFLGAIRKTVGEIRLSGSASISSAREEEETSSKPTRIAQVPVPKSHRVGHSLRLLRP